MYVCNTKWEDNENNNNKRLENSKKNVEQMRVSRLTL